MPINPGFNQVLSASPDELRGLFAQAARRLGTSERNVEKDFWVCLTLDLLFNGLPPGGPRLLFKGGTSLSKAYGLIARFSEDVDVTVFRQDIGQPSSVAELESLSGKKRRARLEAISEACSSYIVGPLRETLATTTAHLASETGSPPVVVVSDPEDEGNQSLLLQYRSVIEGIDEYVRPLVRIESGAKSALEPNEPRVLTPYVAQDLADTDLTIPGVVTVDPRRTFWDKIVIAHGTRRWFDIRGELRQEGKRISRHYYDLHRLVESEIGAAAEDVALGDDCVQHARMFFNRPDFDLASATRGTFALVPTPEMLTRLERDYRLMSGMIFGTAPSFADVLKSIQALEARLNRPD